MGVQIAKKEQKLGIRASSTCTLNFDDLKIPAENVIGGEGQGYKVLLSKIPWFVFDSILTFYFYPRLQLNA